MWQKELEREARENILRERRDPSGTPSRPPGAHLEFARLWAREVREMLLRGHFHA